MKTSLIAEKDVKINLSLFKTTAKMVQLAQVLATDFTPTKLTIYNSTDSLVKNEFHSGSGVLVDGLSAHVANTKALVVLRLIGCTFSIETLKRLSSGFAQNRSLQEISFRNCDLGDNGIEALFEGLHFLSTSCLDCLELTSCGLSDYGGETVAKIVHNDSAMADPWIQAMRKNKTKKPSKDKNEFVGITRLVLRGNSFGMKTAQALSEHCLFSRINTIDVRQCAFNSAAFSYLTSVLGAIDDHRIAVLSGDSITEEEEEENMKDTPKPKISYFKSRSNEAVSVSQIAELKKQNEQKEREKTRERLRILEIERKKRVSKDKIKPADTNQQPEKVSKVKTNNVSLETLTQSTSEHNVSAPCSKCSQFKQMNILLQQQLQTAEQNNEALKRRQQDDQKRIDLIIEKMNQFEEQLTIREKEIEELKKLNLNIQQAHLNKLRNGLIWEEIKEDTMKIADVKL